MKNVAGIVFLLFFANNIFAQCLNCTTSDSLNLGLVFCLPFNGNANDETGNGYNGTVSGATLTTDRFGQSNKAYTFNGTSNYIDLIKNIPDLTAFSISFWIKPQSSALPSRFIFFDGNSACGNDVGISSANGNSLFVLADKSGAQLGLTSAQTSLPFSLFNTWYHVVWTCSNSQSKIYINGVLNATFNASGSEVGYHYTPTIGCFNDGNTTPCGSARSQFFNGGIDDMRFYNRVLSTSEVQRLYNLIPNSPPVISNISTSPAQTICKGNTVQLNANTSGATSLRWTPGNGVSDSTIFNPIATPSITTKYKITATSGICSSSDSIMIYVTDLHANAGPDLFICKKDVVTVSGSGTGTSYSWLPLKYINNDLTATPQINPDTTTTYILTVTDGTCTDRDTMTAYVTSIDATILTPDTGICPGDTFQLRSFINANSFSWSPDIFISDTSVSSPVVYPPVTTTYLLTATRGFCVRKDSVKINLVALSMPGAAGKDTSICKGKSIQLKGTGTTGATYSWWPPTGLSNPDTLNPFASPDSSLQYVLRIQLGSKCVAYDTMQFSVNPNPSVNAGSDQFICDQPFASIGLSSSLADSFYWYPSSGLNNPNILQTQASPGVNTTYYLLSEVKSTGCFAVDTVQVNYIKPKASFTANPQIGNSPLTVLFHNTSSALADSFFWNFGDTQSVSILQSPLHVYTNQGIDTVQLIVKNNLGCYDTSYAIITIIGGLAVFVPTAFTPNNDGLNDEFIISFTNAAITYLKGSIWNRWGEKIYEFEMPNGKWWDGKFQDQPVPAGVYLYIVEAKDLSGNIQTFKGNVNLIR